MKTRTFKAGILLLCVTNLTVWGQKPDDTTAIEKVSALSAQIRSFMNQRTKANVPHTKDRFNEEFYQTNVRCGEYLRQLDAFASSHGGLKPDFLHALTASELTLLNAEAADLLARNTCSQNAGQPSSPVSKPGNAETSSTATKKSPGNDTTAASPTTGQAATPSADKPASTTVPAGGTQQTPSAANLPVLTTDHLYIDPSSEAFHVLVKVKDEALLAQLKKIAQLNKTNSSIQVNGTPAPTVFKGESLDATVTKTDFPELFAEPPPSTVQLQVLGSDPAHPVFNGTLSLQSINGVKLGSDQKNALLPTQLNVDFDITRVANDDTPGQCSNIAYSHDAQIWQVMLRLRPVTTGNPQLQAFTYSPVPGDLYLTVFKSFQPLANLQVGARALDGSIVRTLSGELRVTFANRSLTEVSDLLNDFQQNPTGILTRLKPQLGPLSVYRFSYDPQKNPGLVENAIFTWIDTGGGIDKLQDLLGKTFTKDNNHRALLAVSGSEPVVVGSDTVVLSQSVSNLGIAPQNLDNLKKALTNLQHGGTGTISPQSSDKALLTQQGQTEGKDSPIVIGDNCFQVTVTPNLNAGVSFQPAVRFKGRYDYVLPPKTFVFKLRGEGEGSGDAKDFQRISFSVEGMSLKKKPSFLGWRWDLGGLGRINHSFQTGAGQDEWQAGGKFQLQAPFIDLPKARAGENSKPTIDIEGVASSVQIPGATRNVDFLAHANFTYSYRTGRFTLATQSQNGWSNKKFFNNRSQFSYGQAEMRYNIKDNLDYIARYECGRKSPDYLKFCGWKTGFDILTGR